MSQPKSYLKLGLAVLFLVLLILLSSLILPRKAPILKTPDLVKALNLSSTFQFAFRSGGLSKVVSENLQGKKGEPASQGEYAIYIEDLSPDKAGLTDSEVYTLRSSDVFPAASLYKVFLMAAVLKEIENGQLTMENVLSAKKSHLEEVFGEVDFGYEDAPEIIEYTIEEALVRVGRISDNFAAIILMDQIGTEKVQAVIDELGLTSTNIKSPITTSASDMGIFFKALYRGEVVNKAVSEKVIEFLSLNQLNNRIPAFAKATAGKPALEGIKIIHKTGELPGVRHDAGLVYLALQGEAWERVYVIVLMSKNLKSEDEGVETLAKISKDVYTYFKNKKI